MKGVAFFLSLYLPVLASAVHPQMVGGGKATDAKANGQRLTFVGRDEGGGLEDDRSIDPTSEDGMAPEEKSETGSATEDPQLSA